MLTRQRRLATVYAWSQSFSRSLTVVCVVPEKVSDYYSATGIGCFWLVS